MKKEINPKSTREETLIYILAGVGVIFSFVSGWLGNSRNDSSGVIRTIALFLAIIAIGCYVYIFLVTRINAENRYKEGIDTMK